MRSKTRNSDELRSSVVADTNLAMDASLGHSRCWVSTKGTGDIESIFSIYLLLTPQDWKWVGLRRLPYLRHELAFVSERQLDGTHFYGTSDCVVGTQTHKHLYDLYEEDVSTSVSTRNPLAQPIAFKRPGEIPVCLGSSAQQARLLPLRLEQLRDHSKIYRVEVYNSDWGRWITGETSRDNALEALAVSIEAGGYRLLRFQELLAPRSTL